MSAATPSTPRPSATRCASSWCTDKAGSGSLEQLLVSAEERLHEEGIRTIYLFKNNTDSAGNSYGCHENHHELPADFGHYAEVLILFLS
ncbi:MAG: proteasome accessory factor PafA2 family protein [Acidimicrobiales bacterium]